MIMKRYYTFFVFNLFLFDFTECGLLIPFEHFQNTVEIDIELTNQGILFLNLVLGNPPQYFSSFYQLYYKKRILQSFQHLRKDFLLLILLLLLKKKK